MPITVQCSSCGKRLKVKDSAKGRRLKCPKCQSAIVVDESARPTPTARAPIGGGNSDSKKKAIRMVAAVALGGGAMLMLTAMLSGAVGGASDPSNSDGSASNSSGSVDAAASLGSRTYDILPLSEPRAFDLSRFQTPPPQLNLTEAQYDAMSTGLVNDAWVKIKESDNSISFLPYVQLPKTDESSQFAFQVESRQPPVFVASSTDRQRREGFNLKILPRVDAHYAEPVDADSYYEVLAMSTIHRLGQGDYRDVNVSRFQVSRGDPDRVQVYASGVLKDDESIEEHVVGYAMIYEMEIHLWQAFASSRGRVEALHRIFASATYFNHLVPLPEAIRLEVATMLAELARAVQRGSAEKIAMILLSDEDASKMKADPKVWKQVLETVEKDIRGRTQAHIARISLDAAAYDQSAGRVVCNPESQAPIVIQRDGERWRLELNER